MRRKGNGGALPIWILHSFIFTWFTFSALAEDPELGSSRVVFQVHRFITRQIDPLDFMYTQLNLYNRA